MKPNFCVQAGSRLVQAVLRKCGMSSVVRVGRWLEICMQEVDLFVISSLSSFLYPVIVLAMKKKKLLNQVVQSGPATFAAIVVLDRVVEKAKSDKTWLVMFDRVATALLVAHSDSQLPLVVEAALHHELHTCSPKRSPPRAIFSPLQELAFSAPSSSILMSSN